MLVAAAGLLATACGSSKKGTAATTNAPSTAPAAAAGGAATTAAAGGAKAPTGAPIKVMTVTTLNAAGPTYANIANTAKAYEKFIAQPH